MEKIARILIAATAALLVPAQLALAQETEKPNVVFMMMDNLGWGEIGTYGGGVLRGASALSRKTDVTS